MQQRGLNIGAHHRWDAEGPHHNSGMGVGGAIAHHHAGQAILRHFGEGGGRQLVRHEDNARRPGVGPLNTVVEMEQQTLAQGTQIAGPLFQIAVAQRGKLFGELLNDLFDRPLGHGAFVDFGKQLATQAGVGEQVRVEIEDRRRLFLRAGSIAFAVATKFVGRLFQRAGQAFAFRGGVQRRGFIHLLHQRQADVHPALGDRHPGRGRQSANARLTILAEQGVQLGLGEDRRHLGGEGDEERLFAFIKLTQLALLDHQHAQQLAALNDRHAKEGAEAVLFDGGDIFEAGVFLRIGEVDGFRQAANQPHQAFIERQRNGAPARFF